MNVINVIPNITLSYKALLVFTLLCTVVWGLEAFVSYKVADLTPTWNGTCSANGWNDSGNLALNVDCGDHGKGHIDSVPVIRSYLRSPGPLTCSVSAADNISCESRPDRDVKR